MSDTRNLRTWHRTTEAGVDPFSLGMLVGVLQSERLLHVFGLGRLEQQLILLNDTDAGAERERYRSFRQRMVDKLEACFTEEARQALYEDCRHFCQVHGVELSKCYTVGTSSAGRDFWGSRLGHTGLHSFLVGPWVDSPAGRARAMLHGAAVAIGPRKLVRVGKVLDLALYDEVAPQVEAVAPSEDDEGETGTRDRGGESWKDLSLAELRGQLEREKVEDGQADLGGNETQQRLIYPRSEWVKRYALVRANFRCEIPDCGYDLFEDIEGGLYLEVHHIQPLSEDGEDTSENTACLCASHHREVHRGRQGPELQGFLRELRQREIARELTTTAGPAGASILRRPG